LGKYWNKCHGVIVFYLYVITNKYIKYYILFNKDLK
jgi:hypothetical protein